MTLIDAALQPLVDEMRQCLRERVTLGAHLESEMRGLGGRELLVALRAHNEPGGALATPRDGAAHERTIGGSTGGLPLPIPIRVLEPSVGPPRGVHIAIHGGGWCMGSRDMHDERNRRIAESCRVVVVSPGYCLTPEHRYPACADDCEAAVLWVLSNAAREWGTDAVTIGGESAGAHLAAVTMLRLRDRHGASAESGAVRGASLDCGVYDLTGTPSQHAPVTPGAFVGAGDMRLAAKNLGPKLTPEQVRSPDLSPLYAALGDLGPALFTIGTNDPLLDDTLLMAARRELAGNHTELAVYPEAPHDLIGTNTEMGRVAEARIHRFLSNAIR